METTEIRGKVIGVINDMLGLTEAEITEITDDTLISADLGADSLDQVEIVMNCEKAFSCSIPDEMVEIDLSVGRLTEIIAERLSFQN